jgi:hypothetical protein
VFHDTVSDVLLDNSVELALRTSTSLESIHHTATAVWALALLSEPGGSKHMARVSRNNDVPLALLNRNGGPSKTTLTKMGSKGPAVVQLQMQLKKLGCLKGKADGDFGPGTHSAVQRFQWINGLKPDGVVGPKTRAMIQEQLIGGGC